MVKYMLCVKAELDNLTNFQPAGGIDSLDFCYLFKLRCEGCGEVTDKETCLSLDEETELLPKSVTHLIQKCKFCKREGTVTMIPNKGVPLTLSYSEARKPAPIMVFDCRGFEPFGFAFSSHWEAQSVSEGNLGTKFVDIDLRGGEFCEYCDVNQVAVIICNLCSEFRVVDLDSSSSLGGVYIRRLSNNVTRAEIERMFSRYGTILSLQIRNSVFGADAFVNFLELEDAECAAESMDGVKGWVVELSKSSRKKGRSGSETNKVKFSLSPRKSMLMDEMLKTSEERFKKLHEGAVERVRLFERLVEKIQKALDKKRRMSQHDVAKQMEAEARDLLSKGSEIEVMAKLHVSRVRKYVEEMRREERKDARGKLENFEVVLKYLMGEMKRFRKFLSVGKKE